MDSQRLMIIFGIQAEHLDVALEAMAEAGAGVVGDYTRCSYTSTGVGHFKPGAAAHPSYGERGQINDVPEVRVETFCQRDQARAVVAAIRQAHPYEEPVIYLIPLLDEADL